MSNAAPSVHIQPEVVTVGVDELQLDGFQIAGKVMTHDGIGRISHDCSCEPNCGGRYFPGVRVPSELSWSDVTALLVRKYGRKEVEKWAEDIGRRKREHLRNLKALARFQGSDPYYPTMIGIPDVVDEGLCHDFPKWFQSGRDNTKAERFDSLKRALAPLVVDHGVTK